MSVMDKDVVVCGACERACCWQGEFMCDYAEMAGTRLVRVSDLHARPRGENAEYWFKDADGVVDRALLSIYQRLAVGKTAEEQR